METYTNPEEEGREIEKGERYHLWELWDGRGDINDIIDGDGEGSSFVGDDEDGMPVFAKFKYEGELEIDTVVTVTGFF